MRFYNALNTSQFIGPHAAAALRRYRVQPELGDVIVPLHVHVGRLWPITQIEKTKLPFSQ